MSGRTLVATMRALYRSEINCGVQSFWDGGFRVRLGDNINGTTAYADFDVTEIESAGQWLHDEAVKHYPTSEYALKAGAMS